eukprot:scaffold25389_cov71-Cyclotella_meneghiniana.AAC.3
MKNFMVTVATYLGQPDPIISPLAGPFFGKKGQQLDPHGDNQASASLPRGGKLPDPWIISHLHTRLHVTLHMPLYLIYLQLAHEYPAGRQRINDTSGASLSGNKEVVNQYSNKFKSLDKQYAADIVLGNGDNGIVGPFESAQERFIGGQPLVAEDGMSISPLRNTDRKGGAFVIMLQQFRRALGVMVVRGMANLANHKLPRLHYVRATAEEAKFTAEANHSNIIEAGQQRSSSWYSSHTPEGYATYEL